MNWLLIAALAVGTYATRAIGVELMAGRQENPRASAYFSFVPLGIMAALIAKQFLVTSNSGFGISWSMLAGCIGAAAAIKLTHSFLFAVVMGVGTGMIVRIWIG